MSSIPPLRSSFIGRGSSNTMGREPLPEAEAGVDFAATLLSARSFYFAERTQRLDLEKIRGMDLDRIEREVDVEALQRHLEELTFCDLEKSVSQPLGLAPRDGDFLKLFRLSQLTVEYLLNVQDVLAEGLEQSSKKCRDSTARVEKYKAKAREADARIKTLKQDLKSKRGAITTYEALVADRSKRGDMQSTRSSSRFRESADFDKTQDLLNEPSSRRNRRDDDELLSRDFDGDLSVYVTSQDGTCAKHTVSADAPASDLARRFGPDARLLHRGVELAGDSPLGRSGVRDGETLLALGARAEQPSARACGGGGDLDGRIAELEASIRSEMAVQVQTQLSSLRGSLGGPWGAGNTMGSTGAWGAFASGAEDAGNCVAGALEDDDDDAVNQASPVAYHAPAVQDSGAYDAIAAAEARIRAQMDALERRMADMLAANQTDRRPATPAPEVVYRQPTPPEPQWQPPPRSPPRDDPVPLPPSTKGWTLRIAVVSAAADADLRQAAPDDGNLEMDAEDGDTVGDVKAALAIELDVEIDRIRLRQRSNGADVRDVSELCAFMKRGDVVCHVVRGRVVSDAQADALHVMRQTLAETSLSAAGDAALGLKLDAAVARRRESWRALPANVGSAAPLSQKDVFKLEARVGALHKLMEALDRAPEFDESLLKKLQHALETVCDGMPQSVVDAIVRVRENIEERAALVVARGR
ncbi:Iguana/Dzip1-like DAZ-interacting protein N-terminal-domain-containing protein [Pelagophyceae sp. CCMP2097]|nr:Iguana/Dzip1-like DAZ-interacting protein N-terminal-domain-containing protein [Pelagophyceae sp. CCMP2097]